MRKSAGYIYLTILMVFLLLPFGVASGEAREELSVRIDQVVSSDYPEIDAYVVVRDSKGELVPGLAPGLFKYRVDSMEVKVKAEVALFSLKEIPVDYTILFSNSGVMDGEPLDFQKNAILQFIDTMRPNDSLSLYTIGEEATPVFEELKKEAIDVALVNEVTVTAAQPRVYDSIINIVRKVSRRAISRKVIIVISDGRDQNSRFTKDQITVVLSETGLPLYSIGIRVLGSQSLSNLNEMSDTTGGTYLYSSRISNIPDNLKKITEIINKCYLINLRIRGVRADGMPHYLEVTVDERDSYGKGEKTFIAVKNPIPKWLKILFVVLVLLLLAICIVLWILYRMRARRLMGITKRRCPDCGNRMKDSWDSCPFCKYLPDIKKRKTKKRKDKNA